MTRVPLVRLTLICCCVPVLAASILREASAHPCDALACIDGQVVGISDGDTLTLLVEEAGQFVQKRLRLTEVDTPERGQPWGRRAKQALADKVFKERVRVLSEGEDRYGRLLGRIYVGERDINRELVREGHAWVYRQYSSDIWLLEDERLAREAGLGLWSLPAAQQTPPWGWRRAKRRGSAQTRAVASRTVADTNQPLTCGAKTRCGEMVSCAEARFYLENCGLSRLDGDRDGMPCESLCRFATASP